MQITRRLTVPTGDILVVRGAKGLLEMCSLGDYGQAHNLKADFLGLSRQLDDVQHTDILPLEKKWVLSVSTQYGCTMSCRFCDVPRIKFQGNATFHDLIGQVLTALTQIHPEVKSTERLNIHWARMGEPTFNPNVLEATNWLKTHVDPEYKVHPVISTMMPTNHTWLRTFIHTWMRIKNRKYKGNAGLQLSINSTDSDERDYMFRGAALDLPDIAKVMDGVVPVGRKISLNFAVAGWEGEYTHYEPYAEHEECLRAAGYDVIVFIASEAEDSGMITCGNLILSGKLPDCEYEEWRMCEHE